MKTVAVIGAGFSGLTLAHSLRALGVPAVVYERASRAGGLIKTERTGDGLVEYAANALLRTPEVGRLFSELRLEFAERQAHIRKRYIYRDKPRTWPLSLAASARVLAFFVRKKSFPPREGETVAEWAHRILGREAEKYLIAPALQGIYAAKSETLSAELVLGPWIRGERKSAGSVAPRGGMGELISALARELDIVFENDYRVEEGRPTVVCTSAWAAAEILKSTDPETSEILARCKPLELTTTTAFYKPHAKDLLGFGCLFPRDQGFNSLGVLFNQSIFNGRSNVRSETWILNRTDEEIQNLVDSDRERLTGRRESPLSVETKRWPQAIPHYSPFWEQELKKLKPKPLVHLHGNYLGAIGLAQILSRSRALATEIKARYA